MVKNKDHFSLISTVVRCVDAIWMDGENSKVDLRVCKGNDAEHTDNALEFENVF